MSSPHLTEGLHVEEARTIPELEIRENAKWLALLIDTEGAIGWTLSLARYDRINEEYRYVYRYATPYVAVTMKELESRRTVEEAARLIGKETRIRTSAVGRERAFSQTAGRALTAITLMKPYFDKFSRMATLITTLFKHRTYIPAEKFAESIIALFGKAVTPKEANEIMLNMTDKEFNELIGKATKLSPSS